MADSEQARLKRLRHEEHMSRVFDEVMGLGDFADSSRGSVASSKSGGPIESKAQDETSEQEGTPPMEEDSNNSRQEEKADGEAAKSSSFTMVMRKRGGGGSGGAAFDDALDGLPEEEEEDEDWHYALPIESSDNAEKASSKLGQPGQNKTSLSKNIPPGKTKERKEQDENEQEGEGTCGSANTSHSSWGNTPDNSKDGGGLNQAEETEDSQQGQTSEGAPMEDSNPPPSPKINIKDEPVDEGYDAALLPQNSAKQIKEELDHHEEELRISSVFSVGGASTFIPNTMPSPIPAPTQTAIFIPGRGTVLQAVASLPVRTPITVPRPLPTLSLQPRAPPPAPPPQQSMVGSVRCSGCSKILLKGQTAFQRKGSTQLFCSTVCLTGHLPPVTRSRHCAQCNKDIGEPRDMITIPADDNSILQFCGQFCLALFRHKKKQVEAIPEKREIKKLEKPPEKVPEKPCCSICRISNRPIEHEVNHQGRLHRLCSDACFMTWRKVQQLAMNCCESCGLYCNSNSGSSHTLIIDKSKLNFCSSTCVGTFILTCRKTTDCANCQKTIVVASTIMERDQKGKVQLYCSTACVEASRPSHHTLTGAAFPCSLCKVSAVPQYHLAMVDGTIRNFCSYNCVTTYRKSGPPSQPDLINGTSSLRDPPSRETLKQGSSAEAASASLTPHDSSSSSSSTNHPNSYSVPPLVPSLPVSSTKLPAQPPIRSSLDRLPTLAERRPKDTIKLSCHQCSKQFNTKPLLLSNQGHVSQFCSTTCCEKYKTEKNIVASCENCKQEKVMHDTLFYNQDEIFFCSENCKQTFKDDLIQQNKDQAWHTCSYCSGISSKMLHSHYGGKMEQFCRPHCMSQFTVLHYGMNRCDSCRKQCNLTEKLQCLGSVRNFCDLSCLLNYCFLHFEKIRPPNVPTQPNHSTKTNPVIGDVVSLANRRSAQPSSSADTALTGSLPTSDIDGKNLDHASTQTDAMRPPAPRRCQMRNKSVLCRPLTIDQESMCQLPSVSDETPAVEEKVKVVMVPVPVPVYIPVPMNMYSQHMPVPVLATMPILVPFVVPLQAREMKDAAVQFETVTGDEENQKKGSVSCRVQGSRSCDEVTKSDVQTHMGVQVDPPPDRGSHSVQSDPKPNPEPDNQPETSAASENKHAVLTPENEPPFSPMMDLEQDFSLESLEQKAAVPQRGVKRSRQGDHGCRKSRRRTGPADRATSDTPASSTLNHLYGVRAWSSWIQQRKQRGIDHSDFKDDMLQHDSASLRLALSRFIKELRRPNGETYSPDSIYYFCLGIQQHIFLNGRIENIFTGELYSQFAGEISEMLRLWKPKLLPDGGAVPSRVEESFLWECKQLGAYSPFVLLNTLLFFCTKSFRLTTVAQHQRLSFTNFTWRSKPCGRGAEVSYLLYRRTSVITSSSEQTERSKQQPPDNIEDLEMLENVTDPLRCPVRLYEFYLSRCPEFMRNRGDVFYLQPEREVRTDSSHWYKPQPLNTDTLQSMLTRILAVREVQQQQQQHEAARPPCSL